METTTRATIDIDNGVWKAAESLARTRETTVDTLMTEALIRYLEDESDREVAGASRAEGGRIPYALGRRLLFAETDEEAAAIEVEIEEHLRVTGQ